MSSNTWNRLTDGGEITPDWVSMSQDLIVPSFRIGTFLPFQGGKNPFFLDCSQSTPDCVLSIGDVLCTTSGGSCALEGIFSTVLTSCSPCEPQPHGTFSCDLKTSAHPAKNGILILCQSKRKWFDVNASISVGSLEVGVRGPAFKSCSVRQRIVARSSSLRRCPFKTW